MNDKKIARITKKIIGNTFPKSITIEKVIYLPTGKKIINQKFNKYSQEYKDEYASEIIVWLLDNGQVIDDHNNIIGKIDSRYMI